MKKLVWLLLLVPTLSYANELPLEEYIDVGSKVRKPQSYIGKSTSVIDSTIFEEYKPLMLTDAIHNVPGVYVKRINGISGLTNIRIRGARSIDTKLLYNGIPLQDPSDPQASANPIWGDLASSTLKKVEVLSGASSSTWGSEAIGGVVNIVPKHGEKLGSSTEFEFGSDYISKEVVEAYGKDLYVEATRLDSKGIDATDGYGNSSSSGNFIIHLADKGQINLDYLWNHTNARLNQAPIISGGVFTHDVDDPNDRRDYRLFHDGVTTNLNITDSVVFKDKVGYTDSERRFEFLPNPDGSGFYSDGTYSGEDFILENQITLVHNEHLATTVGHQYDMQWYGLNQKDVPDKDSHHAYSNDYFVEEDIDIDNLHLILAGRENTHERAKSRATFDISATQYIERFNTSLKSHFGTSFREPSLYELYGAFLTSFGRFAIGNDKLSPERGQSIDFGFESRLDNDTSFGATFFQNQVRNKIDFVDVVYNNVDGTDSTRGLETFYEQFILPGLSFRTSYTFTQGARLVDVPQHEWDTSLRYAKNKWTANIRTSLVGRHEIRVFNIDDFTVGSLNEPGYFTTDATVAYQIHPNMQLYLVVNNLFNEKYYVGGYRTPRIEIFGGIKWEI